jgi:6-pyruvoyltetrahydropterin/6-carboxytetrahydropterin synthase
MYKISKQFRFEMAHRLSKHRGNCQYIHGHSYLAEIGVKSEVLNDNGMVIDFGTLKSYVKVYLDQLDHILMLNEADKEMVDKLGSMYRVITVPYEPTAENMARDIYFKVKDDITRFDQNLQMDYVTIWETTTSKATFQE